MIEQCTQRNVAQENAYAELTKLNKDQVAKAKKKRCYLHMRTNVLYTACKLYYAHARQLLC